VSFRALCDVYDTFHINCGIAVEGKEFLWQHKLWPFGMLSNIAPVRSQILSHLTAKITCGLESLTLANSEVITT